MFNGRQHNGLNLDRQVSRILTCCDKSFKEDYIMRIYEFTNPSHYLLPETNATDVLKKMRDIKTTNATDDASHHLKKKPATKKPSDAL
jgi:hypothetical protein